MKSQNAQMKHVGVRQQNIRRVLADFGANARRRIAVINRQR